MSTHWRTTAAVLTVVALMSGCGAEAESDAGQKSAEKTSSTPERKPLDGLTPQQVLDRSTAAARKAGTVRYAGAMVVEDQTLKVDIQSSLAGTGQGSIATTREGSVEVRVLAGDVYLKADRKFWRTYANAEAARRFSSKWIQDDKKNPSFGQLAEIFSMQELLKQLKDPSGTLATVEGQDVDGKATVGLLDGGRKGDQTTLFVASEGEPVPLLLQSDQGDVDAVRLEFTEWGKPIKVDRPPAGQVVPFDELKNSSASA